MPGESTKPRVSTEQMPTMANRMRAGVGVGMGATECGKTAVKRFCESKLTDAGPGSNLEAEKFSVLAGASSFRRAAASES
ncbi:hypothetical protein FTUN_4927 [Frigoriglobus tundricola]|uniref:Uncharacterized protein n=1 Tax=Frigoriglobus tundricola TaxID=2774151 RepID=A0A6M5YV61_9BACT|nr:hypothetical protein FTUN_4927 [Frigoriglobus tundricola]